MVVLVLWAMHDEQLCAVSKQPAAGRMWVQAVVGEFLPHDCMHDALHVAPFPQVLDSLAVMSCIPEGTACMLCHLHSPNVAHTRHQLNLLRTC